jgi:hypothetical protein
MRHASFQDQRQIVMPAQKPKWKKEEAVRVTIMLYWTVNRQLCVQPHWY